MTAAEIKAKHFSSSNVVELTDELLNDMEALASTEEATEEPSFDLGALFPSEEVVDWDWVFGLDEQSQAEAKAEEAAAEALKAEVLAALAGKLAGYSAELAKWKNKVYKTSTKTVWAGISELDGVSCSVSSINDRRKQKNITAYTNCIFIAEKAVELVTELGAAKAAEASNPYNKKNQAQSYQLHEEAVELVWVTVNKK